MPCLLVMTVGACGGSPVDDPRPGPTVSAVLVDSDSRHQGVAFEHAWGRRAASQGYGSEVSAHSLDRLSELGTTWISITPFGFQRSPEDPSFQWGGSRFSESDERLRQVTAQAHARQIRVMIKPHIWLRPPAWVGMVEPPTETAWSTWFATYREFILHYAVLAQDVGIEALCIGNELSETTYREDAWRGLIAEVRTVYDGALTYGAHADEVWNVPFWDALDFIGVSAYFELASRPSPTYAEIERAWQPLMTRLERLSARWERPVLFTELGYRSVDFAVQYPWKYSDSTPVNLQLQADAYAAFFETVWTEPWFAGVYWWTWSSLADDGGPTDDDYTPRGKPAEDILRQYYSARGQLSPPKVRRHADQG